MPIVHTVIAHCAALVFAAGAGTWPAPPRGSATPPGPEWASAATRVAQAASDPIDPWAKKGKQAKKGKKGKKAKLAKKRAKVRERIRALRAWRLTEALDLDEQTAAKLFPILGQFDAKFEKALQAQSALRAEARQELGQPAPDDKKLEAIVNRMLKQQREIWDLQEARFRAVRKVLTPAQSAKILIVLPEIDRTLHRQIRRAMRGKAGEANAPFRGKHRAPRRSDSAPLDPFD